MRAASLRTKFLLVVLLGAVMPLAVVGVWLTRDAERSGASLLQSQLDTASAALAASAHEGWAFRDGELRLLANNAAAQRLLAPGAPRLDTSDSAYLTQLAAGLANALLSVAYVDANGRERWSYAAPAASAPGPRRFFSESRTFPATLPVTDPAGTSIGELRARIRLGSVIAGDSAQRLMPGVAMAVVGRSGLLLSTAPDTVDVASSPPPRDWAVSRRVLESPPLTIVLAARRAPYVAPFARAARVGLALLMLAALVALVVSTLLTARLTRSLEQLAEAAAAVAAGDLQRRVDTTANDEIARLGAAFNAMTESLRRTLAELSQQKAFAAVGEFAAELSHEVRNSLTAVRVDLQHASRQLAVTDKAAPLVNRALASVRRLDGTVTGALRVARSGRVEAAPVDLRIVLAHATASAEPAFAQRGATLEPLDGIPPVDVMGDPAALEQLFLNLLLNAADALDAGGRAWVCADAEAADVVVRISDTGCGFAEPALARATMTKTTGTGLGLPIARRIAQAHGGDVTIANGDSGETVVSVRLRARPASTT